MILYYYSKLLVHPEPRPGSIPSPCVCVGLSRSPPAAPSSCFLAVPKLWSSKRDTLREESLRDDSQQAFLTTPFLAIDPQSFTTLATSWSMKLLRTLHY